MDALFNGPARTIPFDEAFEIAANGLADSISDGLSRGLSEALADPIVQALMIADGVDQDRFKVLLRCVAAKLADREPAASCGDFAEQLRCVGV
jgi:hypothetical protein